MLIFGIETSCDETSAAVVKNGCEILSNVIASQIALHRKTGGVVPEVAAREHVVKIMPVINEALKKARVTLRDIDAIAVTYGPGLLSSLLIGVNAAATLALVLKKPLIPVNHIEGHIYANWLAQKCHCEGEARSNLEKQKHKADCFLPAGRHGADARNDKTIQFPTAVLTVSGGHNELILWKGHGRYQFLGATLDDAAGEAFDKVARLLGLPYPGGPSIQKAALGGDPKKYNFPRAWLPDSPWDFSFSGLKTAVLYLVRSSKNEGLSFPRRRESRSTIKSRMTKYISTADVAASFQEAVCDVLATKLIRAAQQFSVKEIHLAGGVSANQRLRELTAELIRKNWPGQAKKPLLRYCENLALCTDNAAMIAAAGFYKIKKNPAQYPAYRQAGKKWQPIIADPNLEVKNW